MSPEEAISKLRDYGRDLRQKADAAKVVGLQPFAGQIGIAAYVIEEATNVLEGALKRG